MGGQLALVDGLGVAERLAVVERLAAEAGGSRRLAAEASGRRPQALGRQSGHGRTFGCG